MVRFINDNPSGLSYIAVQSQPRQELELEPAEHKPTLEDLCDRFEGVAFFYWLLGLCTQGATFWLLMKHIT